MNREYAYMKETGNIVSKSKCMKAWSQEILDIKEIVSVDN